MALRIFYVLIALAALYLSYDIYTSYSSSSNAGKVDSKYAYEPEDADLTVVEFFDYACIHCRNIHPVIMEAVKKDGRVRYVPRAVLSKTEDSVNGYIFTHQAAELGKFIEAHDAVMNNFGPLDEPRLIALSEAAGIDANTLEVTIEPEDIQDRLRENFMIFKKLGGRSTPMFLIGKDTIFVPEGKMPTANDFRNMFDKARAAQ